MMNSAFRTFLNLLLATSLAVTPVTIVLAATASGNGQSAQNTVAEPCHQSGQEQATADTPEDASMTVLCSCCDDGGCPDDTACHYKMASPVYALPADATSSHDTVPALFITALPCNYYSLNTPPDPPPPVA